METARARKDRSGITDASKFAPAERTAADVLNRQIELFMRDSTVSNLYDAVSDLIVILNEQRQIVYFNGNFADFLGKKRAEEIYGQRPGEAFGCIHAKDTPGGCRTSEFCVHCGAVNAFLSGRKTGERAKECRILREPNGDALDLRVRSTPLAMEGEDFIIFSITDISHQKRRTALERIFFHDLQNTASGLKILSKVMSQTEAGKKKEMPRQITAAIEQLLDQIHSQRDLVAAENRELEVKPEVINSRRFLEKLIENHGVYMRQPNRRLVLAEQSCEVEFKSDPTLLKRVLDNMIKNAVEASEDGEPVTVGASNSKKRVNLWVHNHGFIPRQVQLQIFKRSYSTKGPGRGLGTYSMKLLTERYLDGAICLSSSKDNGTTFTASYPLELNVAE